MWLSKYFVYFVLFSFLGWVYESAFCTIKNGKWQNRGFLYGPICPIYGVGADAITALTDHFLLHQELTLEWWQVFLVAFFGSIVLEYVTSWGLEKLFHAYWWDYSHVPLNINGRVCFPASVGFGLAGLVVVYGVAPLTKDMTSWITPIWMECFGLIFMALLSADLTLTVSALTNFERNVAAMEDLMNQHMEQFVLAMQERTQAAGKAAQLQKEERMRFAREHVEHSVRSMGGFYRSAVGRVQGFRGYGTERSQRLKNIMLKSVKNIRKIPEILEQHRMEMELKAEEQHRMEMRGDSREIQGITGQQEVTEERQRP